MYSVIVGKTRERKMLVGTGDYQSVDLGAGVWEIIAHNGACHWMETSEISFDRDRLGSVLPRSQIVYVRFEATTRISAYSELGAEVRFRKISLENG